MISKELEAEIELFVSNQLKQKSQSPEMVQALASLLNVLVISN